MSAVNKNNNKKLSENFLKNSNTTKSIEIVERDFATRTNSSANAAGVAVTAAAANHNNNNTSNTPKLTTNNNKANDKIIAQQQHPQQQHQQFSGISSKLQVPQTRRTLPQPQQQQQQQQQQHHQSSSVTSHSIAKSNIAATHKKHSQQLQTVATIHHHQAQPQSYQADATAPSTTSAPVPTTATTTASLLNAHKLQSKQSGSADSAAPSNNTFTQQQQQQTRLYQLQSLKSANNLKAPAHSIPPRYQPPPQPQTPAQSSTATTNSATLRHELLRNRATHFNLKYPPDIPQLSPVYIPGALRIPNSSSGNGSSYLPTIATASTAGARQTSTAASNPQYFFNPAQQPQPLPHHNHHQHQQHQQDMLKFVRKTDPDQDHPSPNASITSSTANTTMQGTRLTVEQNRQLQSLINEMHVLKDQNQRLLDENQELRDLCCFLDDDRQKGRKLAREWQRFGRYTASVMRQEVAAYQHKLRLLDDKQQELITDNLELKELCLYLDEERAHMAASSLCAGCGASLRNPMRDDGDGSSSSTNAEETLSTMRNYEGPLPDMTLRSTLSDQTLQYVRSLERRIRQLEEERMDTSEPQHAQAQQQQQGTQNALLDPISSRPEAVVRAMQVLEVREQLEHECYNAMIENGPDQMDDGEKALVREMCNVVWRKLENNLPHE